MRSYTRPPLMHNHPTPARVREAAFSRLRVPYLTRAVQAKKENSTRKKGVTLVTSEWKVWACVVCV